jgi:hypothetical protein
VVRSPITGGDLNSVAATSARNAWAVGGDGSRAIIEHWNGSRWVGIHWG